MTNFAQYTQNLVEESWLVYHLSFAEVLNGDQVLIQMQCAQLKGNQSPRIAITARVLNYLFPQDFPVTLLHKTHT